MSKTMDQAILRQRYNEARKLVASGMTPQKAIKRLGLGCGTYYRFLREDGLYPPEKGPSRTRVGGSFIGKRWFFLAKARDKKQLERLSTAANSKTLWEQSGRGKGKSWGVKNVNLSDGLARFAPWSCERGFESRLFGVGNGVPFAVDRDRGLGNGAPPPQAQAAFMKLMGWEYK